MKRIKPSALVLLLSFTLAGGCTLLEYESTKTEASPAKVPVQADIVDSEELKRRITELEKRVKELEDKLEAKW